MPHRSHRVLQRFGRRVSMSLPTADTCAFCSLDCNQTACRLTQSLCPIVLSRGMSMWSSRAQTVKQQFPGEQLAYIAALAVDASLIFGDRCKTVTYQRLQNIPSISDLDAAFARLSWQNYQELLVVHRPHSQSQQQPQHEDERGPPNYLDCVSTILTHERDVVLANSILRAAEQVGPSGCVAAVIGVLPSS